MRGRTETFTLSSGILKSTYGNISLQFTYMGGGYRYSLKSHDVKKGISETIKGPKDLNRKPDWVQSPWTLSYVFACIIVALETNPNQAVKVITYQSNK